MKKLIFSLAIGSLLWACSKDQRVVKKLDGTWAMTSYDYEDTDTSFTTTKSDLNQFELTFSACKLKDKEWCDVTEFSVWDGDTTISNIIYKVKEDGAVIVLTHQDHVEEPGWTSELDIVELSKNKMIFEVTQSDEFWTFQMELKD